MGENAMRILVLFLFCYVSFLFYYIYDSLMQPKEKKMNFTH